MGLVDDTFESVEVVMELKEGNMDRGYGLQTTLFETARKPKEKLVGHI